MIWYYKKMMYAILIRMNNMDNNSQHLFCMASPLSLTETIYEIIALEIYR